MDWYNDTRPSVREVSDFAPLVIAAAEEGDEIAKQLVDQTVAELGKAVSAVIRKLKMEDEATRVVILGGLFESKYFRAVFEGHVTALVKRVRIIKPLVDAAVGAAIMAREEWRSHQPSAISNQTAKS
jgi:N-acetylglucosamine kinase-like BadF-type ATPase